MHNVLQLPVLFFSFSFSFFSQPCPGILSLKSLNIAVSGREFFQVIHVKLDISIDISISIKPMTTSFVRQVGASRGVESNQSSR